MAAGYVARERDQQPAWHSLLALLWDQLYPPLCERMVTLLQGRGAEGGDGGEALKWRTTAQETADLHQLI